MKYKYQALYELDSLAVVNVKDVGPVKNAFKVLMFPDTRIYQAENPKAKVSSAQLQSSLTHSIQMHKVVDRTTAANSYSDISRLCVETCPQSKARSVASGGVSSTSLPL